MRVPLPRWMVLVALLTALCLLLLNEWNLHRAKASLQDDDSMRTSPAAASRDMFLLPDGKEDLQREYFSLQASGVPGQKNKGANRRRRIVAPARAKAPAGKPCRPRARPGPHPAAAGHQLGANRPKKNKTRRCQGTGGWGVA